MINILSYLGMNIQSEVCLWTLLGLLRTIFDATLFKVNANLKQVWQMSMPVELSTPVQRVLRTMISGVMLVQCFTVYVYLASYIVLLYPVFLEERPTLVLPWLLLAAVRKLLCELTSLALGLGTCVLLGPAKPPCIKFVIVKLTSITPAFYMWILVFSYYRALKVASAFKTFPAVLAASDHDYGLELAVRRRRTKSLLGEEQLRQKLVANYYGDRALRINGEIINPRPTTEISSKMVHATDMSLDDIQIGNDILRPMSSNMTESYEDWSGNEVTVPRDTDRILEQFVLMLLRIGAFLKTEGIESINSQILNTAAAMWSKRENIDCSVIPAEDTETPPLVGSKGNTASYLLEYPQIFNRRLSADITLSERKVSSLNTVKSQNESTDGSPIKTRNRVVSVLSDDTVLPNNNKIKVHLDKNIPGKTLKIESINNDISEQISTVEKDNYKDEVVQTSIESMVRKEGRLQNSENEQPQSKDSMKTILGSVRNRASNRKQSSQEDENKETNGASASRTRVSKENKANRPSSSSSNKPKNDKSYKRKN